MSSDGPAEARRGGQAIALFLVFAFAYFFSALLRAVTATLAPVFSAELALGASDLGLLGGAYFAGFALMQLPLGAALDRFGPRRVLLALMAVAVAGCAAFAQAHGFAQLLLARAFIGVGVSACLMAPLTAFRHTFSPVAQLRANSWMLMTGSLGMLASTLPVQWLLPLLGWRGIFTVVAALLALSWLLIAGLVPRDEPAIGPAGRGGYLEIARHPMFVRLWPLGFFVYGGMVAVQALWAGPWLTQVAGRTPLQASQGLFLVNACMMIAFLSWGVAMPRLVRRGWHAERLIRATWPLGCVVLAVILAMGPRAGPGMWALWCVTTTVVSLSQPALGQAFPSALAGRALSAYNLVMFAGVFAVQWGLGGLVEWLQRAGHDSVTAYRGAFGALLACCLVSGGWYHLRGWQASRMARTGHTAGT